MAPRVIVITGASDGIGAAAARRVSGADNRLLLVGRSPEKTAQVAAEIGADHFIADFSRLDDVRKLAVDIRAATDRIDVLANNAGALFGARTETIDGHEKTLQVNHLAPFLLTNLLLDRLQAGEGVVVNTASSAARIYGDYDAGDLENAVAYNQNKAYGDAKLNNILFTRGLNSRYGAAGIHAVAFDPGNVATNFANDTDSYLRFVWRTPLRRLVLISPERGGANLAFFINGRPGTTWQPDTFYTQTRPASASETNPQINNDGFVSHLWQASAEMVGVPS